MQVVVKESSRRFLGRQTAFWHKAAIFLVLLLLIGVGLYYYAKDNESAIMLTSSSRSAIAQAESLRNKGDNAAAIQVLKGYLQKNPTKNSTDQQTKASIAQVQRELGSIYASTGNHTGATSACAQATQTNPARANYTDYVTLGDQYKQQGNNAAARQAYQQALVRVKAHESTIRMAKSYESYLEDQITSLPQ